jgi:FixJ family two-component response regulator
MDQGLLVGIVDDDQTVHNGGDALLRSAGMRVETYASAAAVLDERPEGDTGLSARITTAVAVTGASKEGSSSKLLAHEGRCEARRS